MSIVRTDPNLPVDMEWATQVCKLGQGAKCCRYLAVGKGGFTCLKGEPNTAEYLDARVAAGTIHSRSDNCTGRKAI